jgi:hypothetical protein
MRTSCAFLIAAFVCQVSCATGGLRIDEPEEPPVFKFEKGTLADFRQSEAVCITAYGLDTDNRRLAKIIEDELVRTKSPFAISCAKLPNRITVDYQTARSVVTHSPKLGPPYGFGHVSREAIGGGWVVEVAWWDFRGGTTEEIAARFGRALAVFLDSVAKLPSD